MYVAMSLGSCASVREWDLSTIEGLLVLLVTPSASEESPLSTAHSYAHTWITFAYKRYVYAIDGDDVSPSFT